MVERLPSLKSLEVFVQAGKCLSFGQTALALGLSASAVSRRIGALEQDLGLALFVRHGKSVSLTPAGAQYLDDLAPAFAAIRGATEALSASGGRLVITTPQSFAVSWLIPRLSSFRAQHPEVDIDIDVSEDITGQHADDFDIGIFLSRRHWPERHVEELVPISVFPVCSPALAAGMRDPSQLADQTLLHVRQLPKAWDEWLKQVGHSAVSLSPARRKDMRFNDVQLALEAAQRGIGVAIGADVVVADRLQKGILVAPFDQRVRSAFSYQLVCTRSRLRAPEVRSFRRWIRASAEEAVLR